MIVFNTFTNYQRVKQLPEMDILIWTVGLLRYKQLGYNTKLFCTKADMPFIKKWHLYELYDMIDADLFERNEMLQKIDNAHFWSTRKIEAMHWQMSVLDEPAIYSDTDIIMRSRFDLSHDALMWSPESWNTNEGQVYVPWRNLSKPEGYKMPQHIVDTKDAYNCGVWWFKDKGMFEEYRKEYYDFCIGNPCKIKHRNRDDVDDLITNNSVWACNAEQRILKAVLDHHKQDVACVMPARGKGWSKQGVHYFFYRISWKYLNDKDYNPAPDALSMLNLTIYECLVSLKAYNKGFYEFWLDRPWLKGFFENFDAKEKVWPVKEYQ